MQESGLFIPRNPLRAWFTTSWWLAFVSLGTSLVSGSLAIVVIALLTLAVVTLPFALVGVLVFALMIPPLRYADRAQLWSVKFFSGVVTDRASPPRAATFRARFVESVRGPTLWEVVTSLDSSPSTVNCRSCPRHCATDCACCFCRCASRLADH